MRAIELAKVAAAAEALRLKRLARREAIRVAYLVVALVFVVAAFAFLHVLAYIGLSAIFPYWLAALIVLIFDLVIAGVLGLIAIKSGPDRIELEAKQVRRESLASARKAVTFMAVAGQLAGFAVSNTTRRTMKRPGLNRYLMIANIASRVLKSRR